MTAISAHPFPCPSLPGLAAAAAVALAALGLHHWLPVDALILVILIGAGIRSVKPQMEGLETGIHLAAKRPLELAVMLLGATLDSRALLAAGPGLLAGIALLVGLSLVIGYGIGRLCGLGQRLALLVACGNSICGNSAIAAAAPVVAASEQEVATALTFTALLGVGTVLLLPLALFLPGMGELRYGVLAGLTVYAVPQVAAATAMTGTLSLHMATLVKLSRVVMLGPVTLGLTLLHRHHGRAGQDRPPLLPWFIIGFAALAGLRAAGLVPEMLAAPVGTAAHLLTLWAMAALGLSINLRGLASGGGRVLAAAALSLLALMGMSLGLIWILQPA